MASVMFSETWNGIQRSHGNYYVETSYGVCHDPENYTDPQAICLRGFSIYANTRSALTALLPATISIQINSSTTHTYYSGDLIRVNQYSPSGVLMRYAVVLSSQDEIMIPSGTGTFTIHVGITTADNDTFTFNETGYRPKANSLTPPSTMVTGRVYDFDLENAATVGASFSNSAVLRMSPQANTQVNMGLLDYGYVNSTTKVSDATSAFSTIQFAVANPGTGNGAWIVDVIFQTRYNSADFNNGILITECTAQTAMTVRDGVDSELKPTLTAGLVALTGTNNYGTAGSPIYVHRMSTLQLTPNAEFKYGDSLAYIICDGKTSLTPSITTSAVGHEPNKSYVRPDTGATVTAGEQTIGGVNISVRGSKWGINSDTVTKTYNVYWYITPRVNDFTVHRAVISNSSTSYSSGGYYYKKDDFGTYCIVEYSMSFASIGGSNHKAANLLYGSYTRSLTVSSTTVTGYYIFSAGDSAMNVSLELTDDFYPYGITATIRLSTSGVLIDYLSGGKGMAIGKTATQQKALDIASDWRLLFYNADVGAYNDNSTSVDLVSWMHGIDTRLTQLENS